MVLLLPLSIPDNNLKSRFCYWKRSMTVIINIGWGIVGRGTSEWLV